MDLLFFTTDNKSGFKTREVWFAKNYPDEYNDIISYCSKINIDLTFKEKVWFYYNGISERPKCKTCGKEIPFRNRLDKPYGDFCSLNCINSNHEEMIKRQKKTFNEKYGVDFYPQHVDFVKKQKLTKLKRYGDSNYNNLEKNKKTKLVKYSNESYVNVEKCKQTCIERYGSDNYSKSETFKKIITENFKLLYPNKSFVSINKYDVTIKCELCGETYTTTKQNLYERSKCGYETCTICNPIGQGNRSGRESEICDFITSLDINYEQSVKILSNRQEIDIYMDDFKFGIEYDGVYWHNELFVTNDYHLNKYEQAKDMGVELIHIFEDEWLFKKDIVKSIIKNRLHKIDNFIYGRNCTIKIIPNKICSEFLENNHIQGNVNSKVRLGLYNNGILVSVMTFSKGRVLMGGKSDEWELTRFCNKINTNVIGGADKLMKYFIKSFKPQKIVSYSDKRLFNGGLYKKLGFVEKNHSKPNYWYVVNGIRQHRFNYRKSLLVNQGFDSNKTEKQIMFERKIYRVYDCGCIRWEYSTF